MTILKSNKENKIYGNNDNHNFVKKSIKGLFVGTIGCLGFMAMSLLPSANNLYAQASDGIIKTIVAGPDIDTDGAIDIVVEAGQPNTTTYEFEIDYTNSNNVDVLISDTLPAEWQAVAVAGQLINNGFGSGPDGNGGTGTINVMPANKKTNNKSATIIDWIPDPTLTNSKINVTVTTRKSPGKKNEKYKPTSCGLLSLNDGVVVLELDPATGKPIEDPVTGIPQQPLFESDSLILVALKDINNDDLVTRDGSGDEDGDNLSDFEEVKNFGTDPCNPDSDGDGLNDDVELTMGTDPNNYDTDGDGVSDSLDSDPLDPSLP